jgi:hypothetical protein
MRFISVSRGVLRAVNFEENEPKIHFLMFAEVEDNPAHDLKIIECLVAGHDAAGDSGDIAERSLVMADLVAHVEAKGEPLHEEVLQATAEVASENRLAAVGASLHQVGVYLSRLVVII